MIICVVVLLAVSPTCAKGEDGAAALLERIGFDRLEQLADETGAKELAELLLTPEEGLNADLPGRILRRLAEAARDGMLDALSALSAPVLAALCLRLVLGREDGPLALLCRLACACELARRCAGAMAVAGEAMAAAARSSEVAAPILSAVLTVTGAASLGASLSPMAALCVSVIETMLVGAGLPMCALAAIACVAGKLSDRFRLDELFRLLRRTTVWGTRLLVGGFVALLALEGRLAAARDTASSHALRQALRGVIPYVGGSVSDSTGALLESAAAARNVVGVTGMALAAAACVRPTLKLVVGMLSLKLAAAVIEPVADPGIARLTSGFADVAGMLVALCAGSALLAALLAGACLGAG